MNLYDINKDLVRLWDSAVDPETGEVDESIGAQIEALEMAKEEKQENIALWIKNLKSDAEAIKAEEKTLADRRKSIENKAERLKAYLEDSLQGEKFSTPRVAVSYRTSSKVVVNDINEVPPAFLRLAEPEVDKTAVKASMKNGIYVPGCELVNTVSMQIK